MDFITMLPISEKCGNIVVVTDRLSKGVIADGLEDIEAETVAKWFLRRYYPHHFLPRAIVSDRGAQFTGALWKRICDTLQIQRRLSTAFSPETDGSTERANEVVETVLRQLVDWSQSNWMEWLQIGVGAICGRNAASTGVAPFFMTHGWNQDLFEFEPTPTSARKSPVSQADNILRKLKEVREWAEAAMATAQEAQEKATNQRQTQAT
jgi:transposase InsO family protein